MDFVCILKNKKTTTTTTNYTFVKIQKKNGGGRGVTQWPWVNPQISLQQIDQKIGLKQLSFLTN